MWVWCDLVWFGVGWCGFGVVWVSFGALREPLFALVIELN